MFTTANDTVARTLVGTVGTVLFAGVCLLAATAPAAAAPVAANAVRAQIVSYSDLNLSSPQARSTFDGRVRQAAHAVCENGNADLGARNEAARCVRNAINNAAAKKIAAGNDYKG